MNIIQTTIAIVCVTCANTSIVHASAEDRSIPYQFSAMDKDLLFNESTNKIESPYSTASVESIAHNVVAIERKTFDVLYNHAFDRSKQNCDCRARTICANFGYAWTCKTVEDTLKLKEYFAHHATLLQHVQKIHKRIIKIGTEQYANQNYDEVRRLSERDIMFLLQWSYGIKRDLNTVEVMLSSNGKEKITATPLLLSVINRHHIHEKLAFSAF